jgi:hypothetical protein
VRTVGEEDLHLGTWSGPRRRPRDGHPVHPDLPGTDPLLDTDAGHARDVGQALRHEAIEPLGRLAADGLESPGGGHTAGFTPSVA